MVGEGHCSSGNAPEPLRFDWIIGGSERHDLDRPTFESLVAELRLVTDFYDLVAERGFALIVASFGQSEGDEEPGPATGAGSEVGLVAEK